MSSRIRQVYDDHYDDLVRFAYVLGADESRAEDYVADAFVRSWRAIDSGRVDSPDKYLRRSVANRIKDDSRRRQRHLKFPLRPHRNAPSADDQADIDSGLARDVMSLPHEQRCVIVCRFFADMDVYETADHLAIPVGTVKSRTSRALATLKTSRKSEN